MKTLTFTLLLAFIGSICFAQSAQNRLILDSLKRQLTLVRQDTGRVLIMTELCLRYRTRKPDSALFFGEKALKLAQQIHFPPGEIRALAEVGRVLVDIGNLPKSLEMQFKALQIAKTNQLNQQTILPLNYIGSVYYTLGDYPKALNYYRQSLKIAEMYQDRQRISIQKMNMGTAFEKMNQLDSSLYYTEEAHKEMLRIGMDINPIIFRNLGIIQAKLGNIRMAMHYCKKSLNMNQVGSRGRANVILYHLISKLYQKQNQLDSSIYYAQRGLEDSKLTNYKQGILESSTLLSELYEAKDPKKSFYYYKIAAAAKDSLFGPSQLQALQTIVVEEQVRQQEMEFQREAERVAYQTQLRQYAFLAGLGVLLLIAFILYRSNKQQKKANNLLHRQKEEINLQRDKAEKTLTELKSTQVQLIQKEKLASLGELTAGIAHEIQNPLNFVNNFAELSVDLAQELKEEVEKPDMDKELVSDLVGDLVQNQEKINHHGKRASSIVKGMLEHSKASTGERQLTDINQLADEYLRLSYHGLRAKDNSFNADYELIAEKNLPKIEVIPQDIGRVLLNLINNAFYAVNVGSVPNRRRAVAADVTYSPKVIVSTQIVDSQIVIQVKDNGIGMSEATKAKIFQPFFTTKPTGEGTGLGLSLAYDIVTKGHGGTLEVESKEGEGTNFTVKLPIKTNGE